MFLPLTLKRGPLIIRSFATSATLCSNVVKLVEVGARDGLQNEKGIIPIPVKIELLNRLSAAGLQSIEAGSFVSPKWVPQMAGTSDILRMMEHVRNVHYPVLVPNHRGLRDLLALLESSSKPLTDEIAVFTGATDAFTKANLNITVAESLKQLEEVVTAALSHNLRVRGYVSVVIECPYTGKVDPLQVRDVAKDLLDMGCYEISLGDTVGKGTPVTVGEMIEEVKQSVPVEKLAGHFHDTFGTAMANVFSALDHGIRTIDSSIAGLGGCPYAPGATGNVATEDVVYALQGSNYEITGLKEGSLEQLVDIGFWISKQLDRENNSRAGRAIRAQRLGEKGKL